MTMFSIFDLPVFTSLFQCHKFPCVTYRFEKLVLALYHIQITDLHYNTFWKLKHRPGVPFFGTNIVGYAYSIYLGLVVTFQKYVYLLSSGFMVVGSSLYETVVLVQHTSSRIEFGAAAVFWAMFVLPGSCKLCCQSKIFLAIHVILFLCVERLLPVGIRAPAKTFSIRPANQIACLALWCPTVNVMDEMFVLIPIV